jgi:AraC-like DNA-binding protein
MRPHLEIPLAKILTCHSTSSESALLRVCVYELPSEGYAFQRARGYCFVYRPMPQRGEHRVTVPHWGLSQHRMSGSRSLLVPPNVSTELEWAHANGRVALLVFSSRLLETTATHLGLSGLLSERFRPLFFTFNQRLETLCRLLVDETENGCRLGPLYFKGLAGASAVALLQALRDSPFDKRSSLAVPPGIRRAVQWLEEHVAERICLRTLADHARLSPRHFARCFRHNTGCTPHQYHLRVRLARARELMTRPQLPLAELAPTCGFCDQAHLGRHFRRAFGITPAAFRLSQAIAQGDIAHLSPTDSASRARENGQPVPNLTGPFYTPGRSCLTLTQTSVLPRKKPYSPLINV